MRSIKSMGGLTRGRGLSQNVRDTWTMTAHHVASIHQGMTEITGSLFTTSDQHVEESKARVSRDYMDGEKILV